MKFGVVNKLTILNRFAFHTVQRNITHLAVITRKTNIKLGILKGENRKRAGSFLLPHPHLIFSFEYFFMFSYVTKFVW